MNKINSKAVSRRTQKTHTNFMGAPSHDVSNPLVVLRMCAASSFFGEPVYYDADDKKRSNKTNGASFVETLAGVLGNSHKMASWARMGAAERMEKAIDDALAYNVKDTLEIARALRNEDHIRTTPQVILVRAANHASARGTGLVREYMTQIARRTDDVVTQFAYQMSTYGKKVPNALKRGWKDYLEAQSEYSLAKYRMENRTYKLADVMYFAHAKSDAIGQLMKGTLKLNQDQTWEALISAQGSSKATWTKAVDIMSHMALLRNLRNFQTHGVPTTVYLDKLRATAAKGQQLPFRYVSAYNALDGNAPAVVRDAVEECLELSMGMLPKFSGRVMSLCDNSGSAQNTMTSSLGSMKISTIANLTACLTARQADEGHVGVFGDRLKSFSVQKKSSLFAELRKAEQLAHDIGTGTEHGIWMFWDKAIRDQEHWDHVFVYSDMQAGHGGLYGDPKKYPNYQWQGRQYIDVPKLIAEYRQKVNPNVRVYLVQVAGYQDTIVPEQYDKTYILGGWGEGILRYAHAMSSLDV